MWSCGASTSCGQNPGYSEIKECSMVSTPTNTVGLLHVWFGINFWLWCIWKSFSVANFYTIPPHHYTAQYGVITHSFRRHGAEQRQRSEKSNSIQVARRTSEWCKSTHTTTLALGKASGDNGFEVKQGCTVRPHLKQTKRASGCSSKTIEKVLKTCQTHRGNLKEFKGVDWCPICFQLEQEKLTL